MQIGTRSKYVHIHFLGNFYPGQKYKCNCICIDVNASMQMQLHRTFQTVLGVSIDLSWLSTGTGMEREDGDDVLVSDPKGG